MLLVKEDIVKRIAKEQRLTQRVVADVLNQFGKEVKRALAEGNDVRLIEFGTFYARPRKERTGRDLRTQKPITIPAGRTAAFRFSESIRRAANKAGKTEKTGKKKRKWL